MQSARKTGGCQLEAPYRMCPPVVDGGRERFSLQPRMPLVYPLTLNSLEFSWFGLMSKTFFTGKPGYELPRERLADLKQQPKSLSYPDPSSITHIAARRLVQPLLK